MLTKSLKMVAAVAIALGSASPALAEYPTKPVRVVVPYNAGGAVDYVGRVVAQDLSVVFDQNFVVDNRPGASASIGNQFVKNSRPDGQTLLFTSLTSNAITVAMEPETAGYDLEADFVSVGLVGSVPLVLVASGSLPVNSVSELIEYAKSQEQPLTYASSGIGSTEHLGALTFARAAGIELQHIPYTGGGPAMTDVAAGRVTLMVATLPTAQPQIEAGSIKALAVAMPGRVPALPDVPTAAESGLADFAVASVYNLLAPADIDPAVLSALREKLAEVVVSDAFQAKMTERGIVANLQIADEPDAAYLAEIESWRTRVAEIDTE